VAVVLMTQPKVGSWKKMKMPWPSASSNWENCQHMIDDG
jgi:hypothetical protein